MRIFLLVAMLMAGCGVPAEPLPLGEPCAQNAECAQPFLCIEGCCRVPSVAICTAGQRRCNQSVVEECEPAPPSDGPCRTPADAGIGWVDLEICEGGCLDGACR
jgi:hypothetical protein